jgi:hypothetical protein
MPGHIQHQLFKLILKLGRWPIEWLIHDEIQNNIYSLYIFTLSRERRMPHRRFLHIERSSVMLLTFSICWLLILIVSFVHWVSWDIVSGLYRSTKTSCRDDTSVHIPCHQVVVVRGINDFIFFIVSVLLLEYRYWLASWCLYDWDRWTISNLERRPTLTLRLSVQCHDE